MSEQINETLRGKADLEFFSNVDSGLVLTDAELLRVHGGSCVASNGGGDSGGGGSRVNGDNGTPSGPVQDVLGGIIELMRGSVPSEPFERKK
jgi:hypothetical protein